MKGLRDLTQGYTADFGRMISEEDGFKASLTVAIRNCFTAGNDASAVKNETEISVSTTQEWDKRKTTTQSENRSVTWDLVCPPQAKMRYWGQREVQTVKRIMTGLCDYEHSIDIGKLYKKKGRWRWGRKTGNWDSMASFLLVAKGEAPNSYEYAEWFRKNPPRDELIDLLERPTTARFVMEFEFDAVTSTELRSELLELRPAPDAM